MILALRRALALAAVVVATLAGGYLALVTFRQERELSVGTIELSVSPGHEGALDLYVPLVDWGARFEAIRRPCACAWTSAPSTATPSSGSPGRQLDLEHPRRGPRRDRAYLRKLILLAFLCGGSLGVLVAFAVRRGATPSSATRPPRRS